MIISLNNNTHILARKNDNLIDYMNLIYFLLDI